jgi:hypothetical protein
MKRFRTSQPITVHNRADGKNLNGGVRDFIERS